MPIVIEHQPPLNIVGAGAYNAGVMEGVAQRRQQLFDNSLRAAALQQADRNRQLNLLGQQQMQQNYQNAAMQRMVLDNYLNQQNQQAQQQAWLQRNALENQQQHDLYAMRLGQDQMQWGKEHELAVMNSAAKTRADLEETLGGVDYSRLTAPGRKLYDQIASEYSHLNGNLGGTRPTDYLYAANELANRALALRSPMMVDQTLSPQQQAERDMINVDGQKYLPKPNGSGYQEMGVGPSFDTPPTPQYVATPSGSIGYWQAKKDSPPEWVETFNYEKEKADAWTEEIKIYNEEIKALKESYTMSGVGFGDDTGVVVPNLESENARLRLEYMQTHRDIVIADRVDRRMQSIIADRMNRANAAPQQPAPAPPSAPAAPTPAPPQPPEPQPVASAPPQQDPAAMLPAVPQQGQQQQPPQPQQLQTFDIAMQKFPQARELIAELKALTEKSPWTQADWQRAAQLKQEILARTGG